MRILDDITRGENVMSTTSMNGPMQGRDPKLMSRNELEDLVTQTQDVIEQFSSYVLYAGYEVARVPEFEDLYEALSDEDT